jgi:hypothetical protein
LTARACTITRVVVPAGTSARLQRMAQGAGEAPRFVRRGDPETPTSSVGLPGGHPEGFIEAFSQLYTDFAERVTARIEKRSPKAASLFAPDAVTGTRVMAFIEAVLKSGQANSAWTRI